MKSPAPGKNTSAAEVTNVSEHGVWLLLDGEELFLPFEHFPWFREASMEQVLRVERLSARHLYWPKLDIDLSIESIRHPGEFPLVSRVSSR
jgi:uncharacterized protein DUF2442